MTLVERNTACPKAELDKIWRASRFGTLPAPVQKELLAEAAERDLLAGETIHWYGSILALVVLGRVGIFMSANGRCMTSQYLGPGDTLGLTTVIVPHLRPVDVEVQARVLEPTRILEISPSRFRALAQRHPKVGWMLSKWLAEDMIYRQIVLLDNMFLPVRQLLARHLLDLSTRDGSRLVVRATQEQLADAIGSVRTVVARGLGELRDQGLLVREHGRLVLTDPAGLHALAHVGSR